MSLNTSSSVGENREQREQAAGARQEFDYNDPVQSIVTAPVGFFSGMARQGASLTRLSLP